MDSTKKNPESLNFSEEEDGVSDNVHQNLLENVRHIHGKPKITPATRTETAAEASEFHISSKKRTKTGKSTFHEADLIRSIKKKKPRIAQRLEATKKNKILSKPLETVYEKRAEREAGYQNVKKRLNVWNDVVSSNRVADQLVFPLERKEIEIYDHSEGDLFSSFTKLTPLEQEFQKVLNCSETSKEEEKKLEKNKFRVSLKEMEEKRKMFAKIKAQATYQMSKSRRQNKIKSKKYHRILRREKTKQQLKDFDLLQKTDPEAALKQLDQLEKSRAQERATLRHRNTGKWAQNQLIKAKYNKESRQALSEQLAKNRELTEKKLVETSDSDSGEDETSNGVPLAKPDEPWLGDSDYPQFVSNFKKWEESEKLSKDGSKGQDESYKVDEIMPSAIDTKCAKTCEDCVQSTSRPSTKPHKAGRKKSKCELIPVERTKETSSVRNSSGVWTVTSISNSEESTSDRENSKETDVQEMFNSLEKKLGQKFQSKMKKVQDAELPPRQKKRTKLQARKRKNKRKSADNYVVTVQENDKPEGKNDKPEEEKCEPVETALESEMTDFMAAEDEALDDDEMDVDRQHRMTISEAFADEDVVAEFQEEKQKTEKDDKPQIIDTSLPGWGSWVDASSLRDGGTKKPKQRRINKRLLLRVPKAPPRKDANKGFVIMNEGMNDKFKEHMVSEVPYPFTKVKDFEAHIRAPIGRTWLPETAHQQLIAPPVVTKLGNVIEPMDEGELVRRENI